MLAETIAEPAATAERPSVNLRLVRRNVLSVGVAYGAGALAGFGAQAVLGRWLGREVYGEYVVAFSLLTILAVLFELGASDYLVRDAARQPQRLPEVVADILALRLLAAVAVGLLAVAAGVALGFSGRELAVTALMAAMFIGNGVSRAFRAGLQAIERLDAASIISTVNAVVSAGAIVALVLLGAGLVPAVAATASVSLATIPASWWWLARATPLRLSWSAARVRLAARSSLPFAAVNIGLFATNYADALVIRQVLGTAATGAYGAAYRVFVVLQFIPSIYADSVYRTLAHLAQRAPERFARLVERSAAALLVLGLPFACGGVSLAGPLIRLVFGTHFGPAAGAFGVLVLSLPLSFPLWILVVALLVDGRAARAALLVGVALLANVGANVLLVGRFGITAAAWTTVATDAAVTLAATVALRPAGVGLRWLALAARALPAGLATALAALALRHLPLPVPLAAGALVYVAGLQAAGVPAALGMTPLRNLLRPGAVPV